MTAQIFFFSKKGKDKKAVEIEEMRMWNCRVNSLVGLDYSVWFGN